MKQTLQILLVAIGAILGGIILYFTVVVVKARIDTPKLIGAALHAQNITLKVSDLSQWQLNALLKVEDPNFYRHHGIDLKTPGAGLTTITQSLVKIYYFDHFQPGIAKLKQTLIARFALDPLVSKADQLQLFINNIYLGSVNGKPVHGFDAAAAIYYHKPISQLSETEYLSLVAMIIAPQAFHLRDRPAANRERTERLRKVVAGEYKPKQLMDIYYGKLDRETRKKLAPASYFPALYEHN